MADRTNAAQQPGADLSTLNQYEIIGPLQLRGQILQLAGKPCTQGGNHRQQPLTAPVLLDSGRVQDLPERPDR